MIFAGYQVRAWSKRHQISGQFEQTCFDESMKHRFLREREALVLLLDSVNDQEIVEKVNSSLPTAKQYKSQIMHKLGGDF